MLGGALAAPELGDAKTAKPIWHMGLLRTTDQLA
jgi:hypothetical protein